MRCKSWRAWHDTSNYERAESSSVTSRYYMWDQTQETASLLQLLTKRRLYRVLLNGYSEKEQLNWFIAGVRQVHR